MNKGFKITDKDAIRAAEESKKLTHNIRQLGTSSQNNNSHQSQILSALDTLGAKLVRSETERETMRRLLNEALDAQEKLENQLERSQISLARRLDQMEARSETAIISDNNLSDDDRKAITDSTQKLSSFEKKQDSLETRLKDSTSTISKLQRKLDAQEQKRARLQRRIEKVENIAAEAQSALEAKALVLLTDKSEAVRAALPHYDASGMLQPIDDLHAPAKDGAYMTDDKLRKRSEALASTALILLLTAGALGLGWMAAMSLKPSEQAFIMLDDGRLARLDLSTGQMTPFTFNTDQITATATPMEKVEPAQKTPTAFIGDDIEGDIALSVTDWITEDILNEMLEEEQSPTEMIDESAIMTTEDTTQTITDAQVTMDRDLSLPEDIQALEVKAFEGVPEAQHDLAALYTAGQAGVSTNYERAAFWFTQAADQGIANAAYNLGVLNQQGLGRDPDMQRALDWYRRAAQNGHPEALYNLGIAYIEGVGTRYNPNMAAAFFKQAAFAGIVEAAYNLGLILENGLLGETRIEDSLIWYRAASENGSAEAAEAFRILTNRLGLNEADAGLLENGESLSSALQRETVASARTEDDNLVSLGALIPNGEQIMIAQIQEQLRKSRLYNGPQDGIVGAGTVEAIREYQERENLPVTGRPTDDLLGYMLRQGTDA
jgi:TPR repeat protein